MTGARTALDADRVLLLRMLLPAGAKRGSQARCSSVTTVRPAAGKQDPYAVVELGGQKCKTKTHKSKFMAGKPKL